MELRNDIFCKSLIGCQYRINTLPQLPFLVPDYNIRFYVAKMHLPHPPRSCVPPIERLPPNTTPSSCFVHADSSFEVLLNNLNFFLYAQLLFV